MIFITLGSQKFQFNRLLKAVDELCETGKIEDEVFAQIGYSDYEPKHYHYRQFLTREEFIDIIKKSDTVITHGGTGAIIGAVKQGKKVIAVPRLEKYGEHVDDHQLQLVSQFSGMNLIYSCYDCNELLKAISVVKETQYSKYESNTEAYIISIENYMEKINK